MLKKRMIYIVSIPIVLALTILGYARYIEPNLLTVKTFDIKTQKQVEPCSIIFFTDTHFGKYYDSENVTSIVDKINQEQPDFVVFGGDFLDNYARDYEQIDLAYLQEEFLKIDAKLGKYAVRGNHDYGGGAIRIYDDFMRSSGFTLLENESVIFDEYGIKVIGYDDYLMGRTDPSLYQIEGDYYNVVIAHEPIVSQLIKSDSENFMLTGHTHGGQVSIPFLTKRLLPEGSGSFVKGFYTNEEIQTTTSLQMYTSSGIGMTRYPFRLFNVPEIIKINIEGSE